jgi:Ca2+:H+ antiporter
MSATVRHQPPDTRVNKQIKAKRARVQHASNLRQALRADWFLAVGLATTAVFLLGGGPLAAARTSMAGFAVIFAWLFAVMLGSALGVARHADRVAEILGEPYGTLVLTLSVTAIEVLSISAVMMHGDNNPTLVRDTLFAIVMIIIGGMVGAALLAGGWRHREQSYNLQGANAYLGVIIPMAMLTLSLPDFTVTAAAPTPSATQQVFILVMSVGLYGAFLTIQTGRHRGFFATGEEGDVNHDAGRYSLARHAVLLLAYMVPVVFLAEELARPIDYLIETVRMPAALGGVIIALLVATPEAIAATRAALANKVQRSINISLGSVLSTIGLTVPSMLAISYATHHEVHLGLTGGNNLLLALTLAVSVVTFASGRTNILQGVVHLVLFAAFVMLIFQG